MFMFRKTNMQNWDYIWKSVSLFGYPSGYKGWKFYNPETEKVIIFERADFDEWFTYKGEQLSLQRDTHVHLPPMNPLSDEHNIGPYIPEPIEVEPEPQEPQTTYRIWIRWWSSIQCSWSHSHAPETKYSRPSCWASSRQSSNCCPSYKKFQSSKCKPTISK